MRKLDPGMRVCDARQRFNSSYKYIQVFDGKHNRYRNGYTEKVKCDVCMKIYNKVFMFGGIKTEDYMVQK